jgi:hypothetical protein
VNVEGWLNDTISVQPSLGTAGQGGDPDFGTRVDLIPSRNEPKIKIVIGPDGTERVSSHVVFTQRLITIQDRVWLTSDGDTAGTIAQARFAISIATLKDKSGAFSHYEVYF